MMRVTAALVAFWLLAAVAVRSGEPGAPAPVSFAAPGPYLLFFERDRDDLTDRSLRLIGAAAAVARAWDLPRVTVAGHAHPSGDRARDEHLSRRRAEAVAAEFVLLGASPATIRILAFGGDRPLAPGSDAEAEAQNHRAEVALQR